MVSRSKVREVLCATSSECDDMVHCISTSMTTDVAHVRGSKDAAVALLPLASTHSLGHLITHLNDHDPDS